MVVQVAVCSNSEILRVGLGAMVAGFDSMDDVMFGSSVFEILAQHPTLRVVIVDGKSHQQHLVEFLDSQGSTNSHGAEFLLITTTCRPHELVELLRLGIRGIVTPDCGSADLQLALEVVSRGGCYIQPKLFDQLADALVIPDQVPRGLDLPSRLTTRESEVVGLVCRGWSNNDIAEKLHVSSRTVKYHVSNVLDKLGARNRSEAIAIIHGSRGLDG